MASVLSEWWASDFWSTVILTGGAGTVIYFTIKFLDTFL